MGYIKLKGLSAQQKISLCQNARFPQGSPQCPYCSSQRISGGWHSSPPTERDGGWHSSPPTERDGGWHSSPPTERDGGWHHAKDYHCNACNRNFTLYTSTALHGMRVNAETLLSFIQIFANASSGMSCREIARNGEINKKTSQKLIKLIRQNIPQNNELFDGTVQADEAYLGGRNSNRHKNKKLIKCQGRSGKGQQLIFGIYQNHTKKVKACPLENANMKQINTFIKANVKPSSTLWTDTWRGYNGLEKAGFAILKVNHKEKEFVSPVGATTNGIENFWSFMKRSYNGIYVRMPKESCGEFLQEMVFRYNTPNYEERFNVILKSLLTPVR